ncbi:TPA: 50S ribosomal protein L21e [Candidatus Micrarchaeota archaeon]|nr:50S ribosomal protein L21e [Candidatus Micrarchaeota archaeon]
MVQRSKGTLSARTRKLKGKARVSVAEQVKTFNVGDKVVLKPRSTSKGMPALRYSGRHGLVVKRRGGAYVVQIRDGGKKKELIAGPIHLQLA